MTLVPPVPLGDEIPPLVSVIVYSLRPSPGYLHFTF